MIVRNAGANPLDRPDGINWPRYDIGGSEALDRPDYRLIPGAVVDLSNHNDLSMYFNAELKSMIASGDLIRMVNGTDLDPSEPFVPFFARIISSQIDFDNVDSVQFSYTALPARPIVEVWVYENGDEVYSRPDISFDTTTKQVTVDFKGNFVSGYISLR